MDRRDFMTRMGLAALLRPDAPRLVRGAARRIAHMSPEQAAQDEDFWFQVRHAFTIDRNQINLNSGSVSPAPRVVQDAVRQYDTIVNMSPSLWVDDFLIPQREEVRRRLAALFGCDTEELAITRNTTEALEIVQLGMDLKRGDEVVTTTQDYPSMLTAWRQRERRDGIVLRTVPFPTPPESLDDLAQRVERAITSRTRVVHICHVTYTTGQIFPVKRICDLARARGLETIVDGAHGFAHFPFRRDDLGCDYYGTSLHKWLTAPVGTGFLYVRREKIPSIWPLMPAPASLDADIRKFEAIGTHPVSNRNAIGEAITFHQSLGAERKAARLRYLKDRWVSQVGSLPRVRVLTPSDPAQSCAIATVRIEGIGAQALTDWLQARYRIHVRPRFVEGEWEGVRVTPNVFTTLGEVDRFAE
ncbi:MAG TPA: aminotransferase class V-fold PLP-dependent enzyme, partial [Gemmatimonadales bacterium]|nr:aminotransferase class V-fold PLP-dependent enzyme [Gemmatimonadales bacterium]